jgi:hypothetical protein
MKLLTITHNGLLYEFRLLEQSKVIQVDKSTNQTYKPNYTIKVKNNYFECNCPGSKYHKKCWHVTMIPKLFAQSSIQEPWTEWAENAMLTIKER